MTIAGVSQSGVADSSTNFMGRSQSQSMVDGILYNARQQKALARATQRTTPIDPETASVSTHNSAAPLLKGDKADSSSKSGGLRQSLQKLRGHASRS